MTGKPLTTSYLLRPNRSIFTVLIILCLSFNSIFAQRQKTELRGSEANKFLPGAEYIQQQPGSDFPSFVRFAKGKEIPVTAFSQWIASANKSDFTPEFQIVETKTDLLGDEHIRFVQTYHGIPVDQTHFILHARAGNVYAFNGTVKNLQLSKTTPDISEDDALKYALRYVGADSYKWEDPFWEADLKSRKSDQTASYLPNGKLVIYASGTARTQPRLAYVFDISASSPMKEIRVCVDASTGAILYDVPMESNCVAATVNTIFNGNRGISTELYTADDYRLRDDCSAAVIHVRDWNSTTLTANPTEIENTTNTWTTMNEIFGGTTLWCTKQSYNYFLNRFTRNSYDDANGDVSALINALFDCSPPAGCTTANNASMSFSGGNMKVGLHNNGVLSNSYATVDIIGHEYTHAVTGATAMLVYEDEWGALNESFSDIFGETIENYTLGSNDWLIGDERDSGPIRSMSSPNTTGDPDTYLGTNWFTISPPCNSSNDECGVHRNSGVQNFWFYLLVEGGTGTNDNGDDYEVDGIGIFDAEAIAYRNLVMYLGPNSDYADARTGSIQAATDLYGACSDEVRAVMDAWYAVGVGDPFLYVTASVTSDYNGEDISCFGASDGEATAVAFEGTSPYTFLWSNGQMTNVASGLAAGTYSVTVTDAAGCTAETSVTLTQPLQLEVEAGPNQTIFYYDLSMACTTLTATGATGGVPPYTYSWSSGGNAAMENVCLTTVDDTITIVTYYVTITDANGCTAYDSLDVCYVDINCGTGGSQKVTVCHYPPDNPSNPQTVCVSLNSLAEHLSHGDDVAACDFISPCSGAPMPFIYIPDQAEVLAEALEHKAFMEVFPDPRTNQATIRFILHDDSNAEVILFDMQGKSLKTLFSANVSPGEINDIDLGNENIPAGVYVIQLLSDKLAAPLSRKVLVK